MSAHHRRAHTSEGEHTGGWHGGGGWGGGTQQQLAELCSEYHRDSTNQKINTRKEGLGRRNRRSLADNVGTNWLSEA